MFVHFVGLMYFNGCDLAKKRVYVPDGTRGFEEVPPHFATLWIEEDRVVTDNWWETHRSVRDLKVADGDQNVFIRVVEFKIPYPVELSFSDSGSADCSNLGTCLPKITDLDSSFKVDFDAPETIVQIPIVGGELRVFRVKEGANAVRIVRWDIKEHSSLITASGKFEKRSITLKSETTDIVFSNTSVQVPLDQDEGQHLKLYSKIKIGRRISRLKVPKRPTGDIDPLQGNHPYLKTLGAGPQLLMPAPGCEGTCC